MIITFPKLFIRTLLCLFIALAGSPWCGSLVVYGMVDNMNE